MSQCVYFHVSWQTGLSESEWVEGHSNGTPQYVTVFVPPNTQLLISYWSEENGDKKQGPLYIKI